MDSVEKTLPLGAVAKNQVDNSVRRSRLLWRAKRGLLENDIIITRFFEACPVLTDEQVYGLDLLLDLTDDELFALMMGRKELGDIDPAEHTMDQDDMHQAEAVLLMLRSV